MSEPHKVSEPSVLDLYRENQRYAEEVRRLREALAPFCDPASYTTDEQECRRNPAMDWCAVHSFRWPCPVGPARAALAAAEKGGSNV